VIVSDLDRTILQLARNGVPYVDIMKATGLSEGSVSWRIHKLRKLGFAILGRTPKTRGRTCR
jgi:DNA-binding Lrp family transcriptional regulator